MLAKLRFLPLPLFASVMGIGGLALPWRRAASVWGWPDWPAAILFWAGLSVFGILLALTAVKWVRYSADARAELRNPMRMPFVATLTVSLLVLATAGQDIAPALASVLWWIGTVSHVVVTVAILSAWFVRSDITLASVTPVWFIPIVGNAIVPLAAPRLGSIDLAWFSFGAGVVLWLALLPIVLLRVLLHSDPLPPKLLPTLAIFIAPPSIIMLSWGVLTGDLSGPVPRILAGAALMFVLLLVARIRVLIRVPFAISFWAYTFPMAAVSAATIAMAGANPGVIIAIIGVVLLAFTTLLVFAAMALTFRAAARSEICVPE
ncbi:SLAC1 anion channel family protein [Microbacterium sp.]|uniref:SLAC1 anion channel family protein n=1 Tax=Microbacterium sp. TaxID=51671 RepID=UPI0025F56BDB|nr:SLAC1 anion channel family protein [Microbacterium sp.]